jgi:hypothetical protein
MKSIVTAHRNFKEGSALRRFGHSGGELGFGAEEQVAVVLPDQQPQDDEREDRDCPSEHQNETFA